MNSGWLDKAIYITYLNMTTVISDYLIPKAKKNDLLLTSFLSEAYSK